MPELERRGLPQAVVYGKGNAALAQEGYALPELSQTDRSAERRAYGAMREIIERSRPDLIHLHQVHNVGAVQAALESRPTLVHGHDYRYLCPVSTFYYKRTREICDLTCGPHCFTRTLTRHCLTPRPLFALRFYRRVKWMEKRAGLFARVVGPSAYASQRFTAAGFPANRVSTLPYFCPVEPLPRPRPRPARPTILYIGRSSPNKGIDVFIQALGLLRAGVRGVVVGSFDAAAERALLGQAERFGCAGRLEIRPWASREAIRALYEEATALVFPSVWAETLGIVGLEALAHGVPVAASDVGGVREWLIEGETGLLAAPKDAAGLAAALGRLVDEPELNRKMGERGIELIRRKFALPIHLGALQKLYELAV